MQNLVVPETPGLGSDFDDKCEEESHIGKDRLRRLPQRPDRKLGPTQAYFPMGTVGKIAMA
jgi:hypothetical protein